jgi:phosphatidylglycerophosphatase A
MTTSADIRFLVASPSHLIACGFGSGLSPFASGTVGTLFAWASFPLLRGAFDDLGLLLFLAGAFLYGIYACHRTGNDLGLADHGAIVWDEIVPFWLVLLMTPAGWLWQGAAFLLFRFFDIVKLPPAGYFDAEIKNGLGVMCDDLFAALHTLIVLAIAKLALGA